ncbi:MAG: hypothetical protein R2715_18910 [Ilumatobacteraceae bacterium]
MPTTSAERGVDRAMSTAMAMERLPGLRDGEPQRYNLAEWRMWSLDGPK